MSQKESKPIPVNTNWALLAWWQELFCVVEELDTVPPDLYIDRLFLNTKKYRDVVKALQTTQGGVLLYREISDRRDPDQLRQVIESRITMFKKEHPDTDIEFHILKENAILNDCKNDLFKNWETKTDHYNNVKDIDAYIEVRDTIIETLNPESKQPKTTSLPLPVRPIWSDAFASELNFKKFEYLHKNFYERRPVRWSHIYNALAYFLNAKPLSQTKYFEFINRHYEQDPIAERLQPNAKTNSPQMESILNDFPSDEDILKES